MFIALKMEIPVSKSKDVSFQNKLLRCKSVQPEEERMSIETFTRLT